MDIGSLTGEISLTDSFSSALENAGANLKQFAQKFDNMTGAMLGGAGLLVTGITTVGATVYELSKHAAKAAEEVEAFSLKTGIAVQNVGPLKFAVDAAGGSLDQLNMALMRLTMKEASGNAAKLSGALKDLHINADAFEHMDAEQKILALGEGFRQGAIHGTKMADAMAVFGRGGANLIPVLEKMTPELMAIAQQSAVIWTPETIESAKRFTVATNIVSQSLENISTRVGAEMLPAMGALAEELAKDPAFLHAVTTGVDLLAHGLGYAVEGAGYLVTGFISLGAAAVNIWAHLAEGEVKFDQFFITIEQGLAKIPGMGSKATKAIQELTQDQQRAQGLADSANRTYQNLVEVGGATYDFTQNLAKGLLNVGTASDVAGAGVNNLSSQTEQLTSQQKAFEAAVQGIQDSLEGESKKTRETETAIDRVIASGNEDVDVKTRVVDAIDKLIKAHVTLTPAMQKYYEMNNAIGTQEVAWADTLEKLHEQRLAAVAANNLQGLALQEANLAQQENNEVLSYDKQLTAGKISAIQYAQARQEIYLRYAALHENAAATEAEAVAKAGTSSFVELIKAATKYEQDSKMLTLSGTALEIAQINLAHDAAVTALGDQFVKGGALYMRARADVDAYYKHQIDLANKTADTLEERLTKSGVLTRAQLLTQSNDFKTTYDQMVADGNYTASELTAAWQKYVDSTKGLSVKVAANWAETWKGIGTGLKAELDKIPQTMANALTGGGGILGAAKAIASGVGAVIGTGIGTALGGKFGGEVGAAVGSLAGPLVGLVAKIFGGSEETNKVSPLRNEMFKMAGGLDALNPKVYALTGNLDLVQNVLKAKTVTDYNAAIAALSTLQQQVNADMKTAAGLYDTVAGKMQTLTSITPELGSALQTALDAKTPQDFINALTGLGSTIDDQAAKQAQLQTLADKYGFTLSEMGPQFAQGKLDSLSKAVIDDWTLLGTLGDISNDKLMKMSKSFQELVTDALQTGSALPNSLKEPLQRLADMGELTDAAGNKMTDLGNLKFTDTLDDTLKNVTDALKDLRDVLLDLPSKFQLVASSATTELGKIPTSIDVGFHAKYDTGAGFNPETSVQDAAGGGVIYAAQGANILPFTPRGTDTQAAMLTPGERVLSVSQNEQYTNDQQAPNDNKDILDELRLTRSMLSTLPGTIVRAQRYTALIGAA